MARTNFSFLSALVSVLALSASTAVAQTTSMDLDITNELISPDGYERMAVLAGGSLPGPLISTTKGGSFKINVVDKLTEHSMLKTTSIHWHGIFQKGTNWADGPTFVNQCPIASGHSFLYDFSGHDQTNTYWYHSHHAAQYCDGLRGPIVIYDPNDPYKSLYDIDDESTIITVMDWYHSFAETIPGGTFPDSTLINGKGRYVGGPAAPLSVVNVEKGKRYRMRLINMACDPFYTVSIDGHTNLTVIETDGITTVPKHYDSIVVFSAQRYSFVLNADQPVGNYWIRANPGRGSQGFDGGINSAILRYKGAPVADPTTTQPTSTAPLNEAELAPLDNPAAPGVPQIGAADVNLHFTMGFTNGLFTMNGVQYVPPSVPVLLQILSGAQSATDLMPAGAVYTLPSNKVIEISFSPGNAPGTPHPFHLHGHAFSIIREPGSTTTNFVNPPRRDTVSTGSGNDNVTIRFVTDNSGPWFLHCHIDFHLRDGLAIVFAEDTQGTNAANPQPSAWADLCPIYNSLAEEDL